MIFILWIISFIKSLNCFSHNYTYQRGIPSLYVSLRDERANFLAVINTHNSFSLFEGLRDVFGTYSQKIIDRKNINISTKPLIQNQDMSDYKIQTNPINFKSFINMTQITFA